MEIYTIGFTKKSAEQFFGALRQAGVKRLLDVRLNNVSQLAGFSKRDDLAYFLRELCQAEYRHEPLLAPTQELLDEYRKTGSGWERYETGFLRLMSDRSVEERFSPDLFSEPTALLCSEPTALRCHRRLVVEYLNDRWSDVLQPVHL